MNTLRDCTFLYDFVCDGILFTYRVSKIISSKQNIYLWLCYSGRMYMSLIFQVSRQYYFDYNSFGHRCVFFGTIVGWSSILVMLSRLDFYNTHVMRLYK